MKLKLNRGFTLVELIIVIAILAILGVILVPKVIEVKENARIGVNRRNLDILKSSLGHYRAQNDEYPQTTSIAIFEQELTNNGKGTYQIEKLPNYKDGCAMVKTYKCTSIKDNYQITLKDDVGTDYDEDGTILTEGTDTNKLFK